MPARPSVSRPVEEADPHAVALACGDRIADRREADALEAEAVLSHGA
jgi:hypothetical protein